ncbi:DNA-binding protein [Pseudomonas sp. SDI]|uniref:baseplate complex protein n=1 Tax=Pseudomonas sp. SDI TaxID=2170734 RepID=UPI000DE6E164|nr:DNA-binding protein [Pseudomonas sp. SDI]PWB34675.1 DNA-binding protein [Pseudomonas sp. SDI]
MTLLLDGQKVQGKRMKVTANLRIEADDMSGQTSGTQKAHKGFKPKTLTVSLTIPYVDKDNLRSLMRLAEATAGGGQLKTYRVVNDTAAAFGIRQVQFAEGVSAREDDVLAQWIVQFTLSEKLSNPEKVESRRKANGTTAQSAPGQSVGAGGESGAGTGTGGAQELTGFESVLKRVDDYLGGGS